MSRNFRFLDRPLVVPAAWNESLLPRDAAEERLRSKFDFDHRDLDTFNVVMFSMSIIKLSTRIIFFYRIILNF